MDALKRLISSPAAVLPVGREQLDLDAIAFSVSSAIVDICESISTEATLALIIEDGHSLDQFSVNVLCALLARKREARVLMLVTTRDPRRLRRTLRNEERVTWMPVRPLPIGAVEALIEDMISPPPSPEIRSRMVEAANGNPLFASSLARQYRQTHDEAQSPATLVELLSKRLVPLSGIALSTLATCIALGKHCTTDRTLRALGLAPIALLDGLAELAELGLIDTHSDRATPAHPLIAEAVQERLPPAMRSVVSFRVAEVLEHDAERLSSPACWWDAGTLWRDAAEPERALRAFRECARHAMEIGHAADAARILDEALQFSASGPSTLEAARELIAAADLSSDTTLVIRGHSILRDAGIPDQHDDIELAARSAVIRDSRLPERIVEMTLGCLQASNATAEHRVLAATLGLKSVSVAQSGSRVAQLIEDEVSTTDLEAVEDVTRLEFQLLAHAAKDDWVAAATVADQLMRAAEGKRPGRRTTLQLNCGIALNLGGKPHAAIDAWQRAFEAAGLSHAASHQVRLAALIAGVYTDLFDDQRSDEWLTLATEAQTRATGLVDTFALPVMKLSRSFALEDMSLTGRLLDEANEQGAFFGSPVRRRWGQAFSLLAEVRMGSPSPTHEAAARVLIQSPESGISGVRDFEIATAATILGWRDPRGALDVIRAYLSTERVSRQLLDRQLALTIQQLETTQSVIDGPTHTSPSGCP